MSPHEFRAWRKWMGLTQAEAAERLQRSRWTINVWEKGHAPIPYGARQTILKVTLDRVSKGIAK